MQSLIFSTDNANKFQAGSAICKSYGLELKQFTDDIDEIQGEDYTAIALRKAETAYDLIKKPVLVSDDAWDIPGLNGFPGAYMHSMNTWFTPDDFIRLTSHLTDRRILLHKSLVYIDGSQSKIFTTTSTGVLLTEPVGTSSHACHSVISMDGDNGLSVAEVYEQPNIHQNRNTYQIWHDFAPWATAQ